MPDNSVKTNIEIVISDDGLDIKLPNGKQHTVVGYGSAKLDTLDAIRAICYYFDTDVETTFKDNNKKRRNFI